VDGALRNCVGCCPWHGAASVSFYVVEDVESVNFTFFTAPLDNKIVDTVRI